MGTEQEEKGIRSRLKEGTRKGGICQGMKKKVIR